MGVLAQASVFTKDIFLWSPLANLSDGEPNCDLLRKDGGGEVGEWESRWEGLFTYFPTFVPEFKNKKTPKSFCLVGGGGDVFDPFSNLSS